MKARKRSQSTADRRPGSAKLPTVRTSDPPTRLRGATIAIFFVALTVRLAHVWLMKDTLFFSVPMGDSRGYDLWAQQIAAGDWVGTDVFYQAPLYPYFLGALYSLVGRDLVAVRIVQAILGSIACVALASATSHLVSRRAGIVAGVMLALYGPAIFFDGLIQKSTLDVLFVCLALAVIGSVVAGRENRVSWLVLGMVIGGLILTRENAVVVAVCVVVWAYLWTRRAWPGVVVVAGLLIVLAPVALRNYAVGGAVQLTTSQLGTNFFIGNNPRADGSYVSIRDGRGSPEYERVDATALAEQAVGRPLTASEVSSYWSNRAISFIVERPADWLSLMGRKLRLLWSATEIIDTESLESHAELSPPLRATNFFWHFGLLTPLAMIGMLMLWPERRRFAVIYAMLFAYAISVVIFFVVARYRYPMVPFLIVFAAAGVTGLPSFVRKEPGSRAMMAAAAALMVTAIGFWPLHTSASQRAITESNLGAALQEAGRVEEAIDRYGRALALDGDYTPALNNLGTALRERGRTREAVEIYQRALAAQPAAPGLHYNLANALMAQGQTAEAIDHFRRALDANPRSLEARTNLGLALDAEGRRDEAIAEWRQVLAFDDRSAQAHSNLGNALVSRGAVNEGIGHLQRSIELEPGNAVTHYDLGSAFLEVGAFDRAASTLREAIRLHADYAEAHNNLGIALASQGQLESAIRHWREALRLKPNLADARRNLELATRRR